MRPRWNSFENFLADMGECPDETSLDRKDNNGNYELANCRWATPTEQNQNSRHTVLDMDKAVAIVLERRKGRTFKELASAFNVNISVVHGIYHGKHWIGAVELANTLQSKGE